MTRDKKVRWGILGVAKINERLLPSFARARNLELYAIASRTREKARAAAEAAGIPKAYDGYEALLDDPEIDVVYNPLPNALHAEWTKKAAARGKHVLCEKPLAPSAAEAQEVVEFCREKQVRLMDGFMWPHHPRTQTLKKYLADGNIGAVRRVAGAFTFQMPHLDPKNIRLQAELGGGSLLDVGCYPVFGIRWAMEEEPGRVWATARFEHGCDVEMSGVLWFPSGRLATFDCGFTHPFRQWLEITGTTGVVHVQDMWLPPKRAVFETRREGTYDVDASAVEGHDQIQYMLEDFSRAVAEGTPVTPSPDEAVKTLRVLDALAKSARVGHAVDVGN